MKKITHHYSARALTSALLLAAAIPLSSLAQTINVEFNASDGTLATYSGTAAAPDSGTTWNGLAVGPETGAPLIGGITSDALITSAGEPTPVTVSLGNFKVYEADEKPAALATHLLTAFIYQPNLGPGGPDGTFAINNLDPLFTYDLYLYGQNGGYAGTASIFTIGGDTQTTSNGGNGVTSFTEGVNYVVFTGLVPDESGTIAGTFNSGKPGDNAAFSGLQIVQHGLSDPPHITAQPARQKVLEGGTVTLTVSATGAEPLSYEWSKDGSPLTEQTATLTLFDVTLNDSGIYRVRVTNDFGFADSDPATLTVVSPPARTINVDFNTTDGTQAAYSGTGAAPDINTTWNGFAVGPETGGPVIGSVTSDALITSAGEPTPVTVSLGNFKVYEANENPAGLAPDLLTTFIYQPNLGPGGPDGTFSIHNLNPLLTYDLYLYSQNGGYAGTATIFTIGGASQTAANAGNGVITFAEGVNYVLFSELVPDGWGTISGTFNDLAAANNAAFTGLQIVQYEPDPIDAPPGVAVQPTNQTAIAGNTVTFAVSATGTPPLSYQWSKDGSPLAGETSATLALLNVTLNDGGLYRVRVTNDFGFADSDPATLTLINVPPSITTQPAASQRVVEGRTATFTVSATGSAPLRYQWSKDGSPLAGETMATLTLLEITLNDGGLYRVRVTNDFGFADSDPATLIVIPPPAQVTINVDFNTTDGTLAAYSGTAAAPDLGVTWNGLAVGAEAGSLLIGSVTSDPLGTSFGLPTPVTVSLGNFKAYEANEKLAGLAPNMLSDFVYQPNLGPGGPDGTFTINNLDPWLTYDVYLYGQNGGYAGAVMIFTIGGVSHTVANAGNGVTTFTAGVNYVVFTGLVPDESGTIAGTFNSGKPGDNAAFTGLQILQHGPSDPPLIATQPASQKGLEGGTVTFTVSVTGAEPLSYEWSKDGLPLDEQTATLTLFDVTTSDNGLYRVRVINDFGSAESDPATLTVVAPPAQTINVDFNTTDGSLATYSGTAALLDGGTTWNGFAVGAEAGSLLIGSIASDALITSAGEPTPVTVSLGNFKVYEANEKPAGVASDLMSDFVYQQNLGPGGPDGTFAINNLDPLLTYDLYLYAQNGGYAGTATIFTVGGVSKTAANAGNITSFIEGVNHVVFSRLTPDGSGTISGTFNSGKPSDNAAFTGLQIAQIGTVAPTLSITRTAPDTLSISWTPAGSSHRLQSAPAVTGPWTDLSTVSPTTLKTTDAPAQFFRVAQ